MNKQMLHTIAICILSAGITLPVHPQEPESKTGVPVSMIVSVEAKHGKQVPTVYPEDVRVFQDDQRMHVTEWIPLQGEQAGLELFLLIDDAAETNISLHFNDLRKFIIEQPSTTAIALGYIRFGTVQVAQELTRNHELVNKALRLPTGSGGMASPYIALTELMHHWPESTNRRHIFMISSGIDALQPGSSNTYLEEAIEVAQRKGIQVYSIYAGPDGHVGHSLWRINWGQSNLSQLADETGGEAYFQGLHTPVSFGPYMGDFAERLKNQYKLTFLAKPRRDFVRVKLDTEVSNADLVAADRVYVGGTK